MSNLYRQRLYYTSNSRSHKITFIILLFVCNNVKVAYTQTEFKYTNLSPDMKITKSGSAYFVSNITVVPFFTVTTGKSLLNTMTDSTLEHSDGAFIVQTCLPQLGETPACNIIQEQSIH